MFTSPLCTEHLSTDRLFADRLSTEHLSADRLSVKLMSLSKLSLRRRVEGEGGGARACAPGKRGGGSAIMPTAPRHGRCGVVGAACLVAFSLTTAPTTGGDFACCSVNLPCGYGGGHTSLSPTPASSATPAPTKDSHLFVHFLESGDDL